MKKVTKNLQDLVKKRKTPTVVTKQGSLKIKKYSSGTDIESYCYSSYGNN